MLRDLGRLALAPVAEWLRHEAIQAAVANLAPAWRDEVGRLLPAEGSVDGTAGRETGTAAMADAWQRHRFLEGLARALIAPGRPTLLVLDNIQWCDLETLALITFCLRLASGCPLLVAGTLRDDDPGADPEFGEWTVRMRAAGVLTEISLAPLGSADTARLAAAVAGRALRPAEANLLHATTGGFPLYVIEAIRSLAGPDGGPRPAVTWRPCCASGSSRRPRPPARWPASPRRWGRTSPSACSPRRATSTPTRWCRRSTSCGGGGSCGSSATATTSPTRCSASRLTRKSARRNAGCYTDVWRRASSCCTPTTWTRSPPSSPSSTTGPGGMRGRWTTTGARPAWRPPGSGTPRRSGCTGGPCRSSSGCRPGRAGMHANSPSWRRSPRRSTPGTATHPRSCSRPWNVRWPWPSHSAARTRWSPRWSRCGPHSTSRAA